MLILMLGAGESSSREDEKTKCVKNGPAAAEKLRG